MSIVYRQELGRELTWSEADNNFAELKAGVDSKKSNFDVLPFTQGGTGQDTIEGVKVAFDIATKTELSSSADGKGAELVEYHGATVEAALNERLPEIGTYALLRAYTGPVTAFFVRGVANIFDGGAGVFRVDAADTTTADNGGTMLVDASGRRWKRDYSGKINVKWFGAKGDGVNNDGPAGRAAIAAARAAGGGTVYFPGGYSYLIRSIPNASTADGYDTGLLVSYTGEPHGTAGRVHIVGDGPSSVLLAGDPNMIILRCGDSHSIVDGLSFRGNGMANAVGMLHGPESLTSTTETYQIYNVYSRLYFRDLAIGWWGQSSNTPNGAAYYATLQDSFIYGCNIGLYLPVGAYANGGCGRSLFQNLRIGQGCNTGIYAPGGIGTMTFVHVNVEGVESGTSPLATPTAIYLDGFCDGGTFINSTIEGCTQGVYNNGNYVYWFGGTITGVVSNNFVKPFHINASNGIDLGGGKLSYSAPNSGANECYLEINPSATPIWNLRFNYSTRQYIGTNGYHKLTSDGAGYTAANAYHEIIGKDNICSLYVKSTAASQSGSGGNIISAFGTAQGTGGTLFAGDDGASRVFRVRSDGNVYNTNGVFAAFSDRKLKKDIVDASSQWGDIKALKFKKYRFKSDPDEVLQLGLIAQEVEKVSPGLVDESEDFERVEVPVLDADGNQVVSEDGRPEIKVEFVPTGEKTKSVKYSILYLKAVVALQEAMERIEALERDVQALKAGK